MTERHAHLVGSLPGATAREAMSRALDLLGPHLTSLPDGETGERRNWILSVIEGLRDHPDLELAKDGDWSDYDRVPRLKVRRSHRLYGAALDFGHVSVVRESLADFRELTETAGRTDLDFQQGVPGDLDLAVFTLGPPAGARHRRAFTEATIAEVRDVADLTGERALFQLEVPFELAVTAKAPAPVRRALVRGLARGITGVAAGAAPGTRFAVHLCMGDMNNRPIDRMTDADPVVQLTNALVRAWPDDRPLELVHAPFAAGDVPAPTDPDFYAPLAELDLPPTVRFAAGIAHESQGLDDQRGIRDRVEWLLGRPVDVAAACGLGRRTDEAATEVMRRTADLCAD